ncbi:MAG: FUSC family protein [Chitinophagales bacterium]|nr:FUSC family protein [Chitinophagales bacterium]
MRSILFNNKSLLYSFRILLGSLIVWWSLNCLHDNKKIWAVISVIVVSDPDFDTLRVSAISRIVNTLMGCLIGLLFMYIAGINLWSLMTAITVSVLISTSFKKYPSSWKLAPATVAILMVPAITDKENWLLAMQVAMDRTGEILYGCFVALMLGIILTSIRKRLEEKYTS